jgi:hypothetical protein
LQPHRRKQLHPIRAPFSWAQTDRGASSSKPRSVHNCRIEESFSTTIDHRTGYWQQLRELIEYRWSMQGVSEWVRCWSMVLTDVIYTMMPHQGKSNSGAFWDPLCTILL